MDVAPWDEHWIKMVLNGIDGMVIAWYSMVQWSTSKYLKYLKVPENT